MYLLTELEEIVQSLLQDKLTETNNLITQRLLNEVSNLEIRFKEVFVTQWSDEALQKFTKVHHDSLLDLLTGLLRVMEVRQIREGLLLGTEEPQDDASPAMTAFVQIREVLRLIHKHYGKYIPKEDVIPALMSEPLIREVRQMQEEVLEQLKKVDADLRNVFLQPFIDFSETSENCTLHTLFYCREMKKELFRLASDVKEVFTEDLLWMLYFINFNSVSFYHYFRDYIRYYPNNNYLRQLHFFRKELLQAPVKPDVAFVPKGENLSSLMLRWIDAEIAFVNSEQYKYESPGAFRITKDKDELSKIQLNASVPELACFMRTLVKAGFVNLEEGNIKAFCETVSAVYCTSGSSLLSPGSFKNKFYAQESRAKKAVKTMLLSMVKEMDEA